MNTTYVGSELDLFSRAENWKAYWSGIITPYIGRRILDVGAGIGSTARILRRIECESYLALEPDQELVARMEEDAIGDTLFHRSFEVMTGTSETLLADQKFDTILYIDVLEHIRDDKLELERAASHLTSGGRIVILSPAHQWLYTEFDRAIGHERRYDKRTLLSAKPSHLVAERIFYLDSVGMLASLGNRLLLKASSPTPEQIKLWDSYMVPASRILDKLACGSVGKSIIAVFRASD